MDSGGSLLHLARQAREHQRHQGLKLILLSMVLMLVLLATPQGVWAHASLVESIPPANAELEQAPAQIKLTFNERLEEGLLSIKVLDMDKKQMTANKAQINKERTQITLDLPQLGHGSYLVTYQVVSADGHPLKGTYLFAIGQSLTNIPIDETMESEHLHTEGLSTGLGFTDIVHFISRIAYYAFMLAFTGWVLWLRFSRIQQASTTSMLKGWTVLLQRGFIVAFIFMMFTHLFAMIGDGGSEALAMLFTHTNIGYVWMASLVFSLLGFVLLYRSLWLDLVWVVMIWFTKSLNGHAAAFEPKVPTIVLDVVHLAAAALWIGGLLLLLVLWRHNKEEAATLFPRVSGMALATLAVLVVSGVLSVFIFLPNVGYILETNWGKLLLAKSTLVLLVIVTGALLRFNQRRRAGSGIGTLLRIDAVLAGLIIGIVGVFTYLTPLPANAPLNWHVMGEKIHMSAQITPNIPGVNDFTVKIWLPEELGKPKQVLLKMSDMTAPDMAPLDVPLEITEDTSMMEESYGMKKYTYKSRGAYLPYPGYWKIEVRAMNSNDDETVYEKQIRLF
ncbi:copper resistance CopC/CopD family protein [Paenibacillus agricola]|uniref:Copper resistance protein CopC/CopD n=1 Tax=Paenibacillus agricola TaxID=2716264 RepID=A0ABX0J5E5_9BACL|nr:copper resistance protein CopC [Paenibacillus agricola]NHN29321.1 copper resistance protein CopC/CopD [Paenibacillus agricola]